MSIYEDKGRWTCFADEYPRNYYSVLVRIDAEIGPHNDCFTDSKDHLYYAHVNEDGGSIFATLDINTGSAMSWQVDGEFSIKELFWYSDDEFAKKEKDANGASL